MQDRPSPTWGGIKPRRRGRRVEEEPKSFGPAPSDVEAAPDGPLVPHDRAKAC